MSTNDPFAIIALTGGIASGKSTVSQMFRDLGIRVIDADRIAREVVEPGEPALQDIRETFGDEVIDASGELDREALGTIIFDDDDARSKLDAITHPRIAQRMREKATEARQSGEPWVLYDAALIVENGLQDAFEALIVVAADRDIQIDRLCDRDDLTREEAAKRIDAQMPLSEKVEVADWVIDNNHSLEQTRDQVEHLYEIIDRGLSEHGTAARAPLVEENTVEPATLQGLTSAQQTEAD